MAGRLVDERHGDDFSDRDAVRYHVAGYWRFYSEHRTLMSALEQAATVDESFAERARELIEPDIHHIAAHLVRAREGGLRLPGDPLVVATAFTTLVPAFSAMWQSGRGPARARPARARTIPEARDGAGLG